MTTFSHTRSLFKKASKEVPAYQDFLKKNKVVVSKVQTLADFEKVPITDKKNYISKYPFTKLLWKKETPSMAYASSGSSGKPTFWFGNEIHEQYGGRVHENIFHNIFGIKKTDPTLVVVCFGMGVWVAGSYTVASCKQVSKLGYELTTITPGIEKEDVLLILKKLAPSYKNVILVGLSPFLISVLADARKRGIRIPQSLKVITSGDKFGEKWRTDMLDLIGAKDPYSSVINLYGSADAAVLGYETPLGIFARRKAEKNKEFAKDLFGENFASTPGLVQYDPAHTFFEEVEGELVFTTNTPIPLIRYNIRDRGYIVSGKEMKKLLRKYKLLEKAPKKWSNLPFLVIQGRNDVAVTFYAFNVPADHLKAGLEDKRASRFLTGSFFAYNRNLQKSTQQRFFINVELKLRIQPTKKTRDQIQNTVFRHLMLQNSEFRKTYSTIGTKALPIIVLTPYNSSRFHPKNMKGVLNIYGKKPKMII